VRFLGPAARHLLAGGLLGLVVVLASWVDPHGYFSVAELKALDSQFKLRGPLPASTPIVIVSVDEGSLDELEEADLGEDHAGERVQQPVGPEEDVQRNHENDQRNLPWPWPRALHAKFLDIVSAGRPAAIGLDILFAEPSGRGPADDEALAAGIKRAGNVVLAAALTFVREPRRFDKEDLNPPIPLVREGAAGFGFANFETDADTFLRRASLSLSFQEGMIPSFALLVLREAGKRGITGSGILPGSTFLINFRGGPRTFRTIPYYQVIRGEVPPEAFAGKIVLVGATSPVLHDLFPTPFAPTGNMPGVEVHANVLETLLLGIPIEPLPRGAPEALTILAGAFAVWAGSTRRPFRAFAVVFGAGVAYLGLTHDAFLGWRYWMPAVSVPLALVVGYSGAAMQSFLNEQREKRRLSRFFSPSVVREIVRSQDFGEPLQSGRRRLTVLFSDIRGFTTLSERLAPEDVVEFLREYLTVMTDAVFTHGGTVDKYIGDAIMALYNVPFEAPDHAAQAVRTALEFQRRLEGLAARFGPRLGAPLRCGVGIHTGDAVVGTLGSAQRLEYTAIGDTVNLGSRLESITKDFDVPIVISEATWMEVKDLFRTRYLGEVTVKGKEVPVKIYTVLDDEDPTRSAASPSR
jgi:adenylate cyclase